MIHSPDKELGAQETFVLPHFTSIELLGGWRSCREGGASRADCRPRPGPPGT